ncbi:MAG: DUF4974 domain-containing protein [Bacteroidia bacterium]|nr:DUF4974 domain-containing protein [Bacteroidia bacterium]
MESEENSQIEELMAKYLSGNASPQEIEELEAWVMADSENRHTFKAFKKAWMLTGATMDERKVDVNQLWKKTSKELFPQAKVVPLASRRNTGRWLLLAAAVVAVLILGIWLINNVNTQAPQTFATAEQDMQVELADGTKAHLNKNTRITFLPKDENGNRKLQLEGVAFLKVARDVEHPLEVVTNSIQVRVLGTAFLVDARDDRQKAEVIVASGHVRVSSPGLDSVELLANEKAVFDLGQQKLVKSPNTDQNYLSFAQDSLIFDKTPLGGIIEVLGRHFDKKIKLENESLKNCKFTGTFTDESLREILTVIANSLNINVKKEENAYLFSGTCN